MRFGVAPDHPEVKLVENKFEDLARDPRVNFIGNVSINKVLCTHTYAYAVNIFSTI